MDEIIARLRQRTDKGSVDQIWSIEQNEAAQKVCVKEYVSVNVREHEECRAENLEFLIQSAPKYTPMQDMTATNTKLANSRNIQNRKSNNQMEDSALNSRLEACKLNKLSSEAKQEYNPETTSQSDDGDRTIGTKPSSASHNDFDSDSEDEDEEKVNLLVRDYCLFIARSMALTLHPLCRRLCFNEYTWK